MGKRGREQKREEREMKKIEEQFCFLFPSQVHKLISVLVRGRGEFNYSGKVEGKGG